MYRQLLQLLADGYPHSARQLNECLGFSDTSLALAIETLNAYGIVLHQVTPDAYQWCAATELLDRDRILTMMAELGTAPRLAHLTVLEVVDSTNHYICHQPPTLTPVVCLAEYQTAGRGQRGRSWISPYASGLCLSIRRRYAHLPYPLSGLTIAIAVTVARVLQCLGVTDVGLKWPNDVWYRGRKLAGMLLESRQVNSQEYDLVVGIGVNVRLPVPSPWTDLTTALGSVVSRNKLAALLIDQCLHTLNFYPQVGLADFLPEWQRLDLLAGQPVNLTIHHSQEMITGRACGIDEHGGLLLQTLSGKRRYTHGEVSVRL